VKNRQRSISALDEGLAILPALRALLWHLTGQSTYHWISGPGGFATQGCTQPSRWGCFWYIVRSSLNGRVYAHPGIRVDGNLGGDPGYAPDEPYKTVTCSRTTGSLFSLHVSGRARRPLSTQHSSTWIQPPRSLVLCCKLITVQHPIPSIARYLFMFQIPKPKIYWGLPRWKASALQPTTCMWYFPTFSTTFFLGI